MNIKQEVTMSKSPDLDTINKVSEILETIETTDISDVARLSVWLGLTQRLSVTNPDILSMTIFNTVIDGICNEESEFGQCTVVFTAAFDSISNFVVQNFNKEADPRGEPIVKTDDDDFIN